MHGCRRKVHWIGTRTWGDGVEYFHNRPSIPNPSPEIYSNGKTRIQDLMDNAIGIVPHGLRQTVEQSLFPSDTDEIPPELLLDSLFCTEADAIEHLDEQIDQLICDLPLAYPAERCQQGIRLWFIGVAPQVTDGFDCRLL